MFGEPSLVDMMSDNVVPAVMRRDGVRYDDILNLIQELSWVRRCRKGDKSLSKGDGGHDASLKNISTGRSCSRASSMLLRPPTLPSRALSDASSEGSI